MTQVSTEQPKLMNRWIIVIAAVVVQFALGAIYSYSFIKKPMMAFAGTADDTTGLLPFAFALLFFAILMIPAGRLQDKKGPKLVAITGSLVLLAGVVLAGILALPASGSIWGMVATFGMIGGSGIGLVYVCPIACATKWFPDKIGLINGLAVAGFGAGSILFNFVYSYMALDAATLGPTLIFAGLLMGGMSLGGAIILQNPPAGYKPAGWEPPAPKPGTAQLSENWETKDMVKTKTFYLLWAMYVMSAICGLMVIGNFVPYGKKVDTFLADPINAYVIVLIAAVAGVCNAVGRIFWGKLSDKIGRLRTMTILFVVQAAAMMVFAIPTVYTWAIFGNLVYFCFGGNLALFPATTRSFFGAKYMGLNYALVFTAYGTAGILGALLAGPVINALGGTLVGYTIYFVVFGCMSLASLVLSFITKAPARK
ncbi:MAG: OFA family MFS transporter [Candidatus Lokiarchaeota archaeon]|nr:OFA family MFS transporter [Candidatus Lokiarchaeota archaeon]